MISWLKKKLLIWYKLLNLQVLGARLKTQFPLWLLDTDCSKMGHTRGWAEEPARGEKSDSVEKNCKNE